MAVAVVAHNLVEESVARVVLEDVDLSLDSVIQSVKAPLLRSVEQEAPAMVVHAQHRAFGVLDFVL